MIKWITRTGGFFGVSSRSLSLIVSFLLVAGAASCTLPLPSGSATTQAQSSVSTAVPKQPLPEHRIGVRVVNGVGEFYNRITGEKFVPRGANYVVISLQKNRAGEQYVSHATFGPGFYDRGAV